MSKEIGNDPELFIKYYDQWAPWGSRYTCLAQIRQDFFEQYMGNRRDYCESALHDYIEERELELLE